MSVKPEALRLANDLEAFYRLTGEGGMDAQAADELLHQHAEIERLKADNERLRQINWSHEMKLSVRGYEMQIDSLKADNERLREALDKSLTDEQIKQIAALIDRAMPLESAKILFARGIEAALKEVPR